MTVREAFEAWIPAQGRESRVDPQPCTRDVAGVVEQRIERVERALGLSRDRVDAGELVLMQNAHPCIARQGAQCDGTQPGAGSLRPATEVGERQTELAEWLRIGGRGLHRGLVLDTRGVGIRPGSRDIAHGGVRFREGERPACRASVERIGAQRDELAPLAVVEDPLLAAVRRHIAQE